MSFVRSLLCILFALLAAPLAHAQDFVAVPPLTAPVMDLAGMLNAGQRGTLNNVLREYESRTGSQIAVLLINSTAPEAIEQYSIRVADTWKLGRKGVDDGVILVVAKENPKALRRLRIEAGRGVQGTLTDAQSKRILQDVIAPHFRQNDFYGGLVAGVAAVTSLLDEEHLPAAARHQQRAQDSAARDWRPILFIAFIVFMLITSRMRRGARSSLSSNGWGRTAGIILGSGIGNSIGRGGGFGGGSSGGGFSGGGGGFDGGGASGDW